MEKYILRQVVTDKTGFHLTFTYGKEVSISVLVVLLVIVSHFNPQFMSFNNSNFNFIKK